MPWDFELQADVPEIAGFDLVNYLNLALEAAAPTFSMAMGFPISFQLEAGKPVLSFEIFGTMDFSMVAGKPVLSFEVQDGKVFTFELKAKMPRTLSLSLVKSADFSLRAAKPRLNFSIYHQVDLSMSLVAGTPAEIIANWTPILEEVFGAWILGSLGLGHSQYDSFPINSIGVFQDRLYGTGPDGLSLLEGDDDDGDPIVSTMAWNASNYGLEVQKRFESLCAYVRTQGVLKITTIYDEQRGYVYSLSDRPGEEGAHRKRLTLGKGDKGGTLQLKVTNPTGINFTLRQVDAPVVPLSRR